MASLLRRLASRRPADGALTAADEAALLRALAHNAVPRTRGPRPSRPSPPADESARSDAGSPATRRVEAASANAESTARPNTPPTASVAPTTRVAPAADLGMLDLLPDDLVIAILSRLAPDDIARAACAHRRLRKLLGQADARRMAHLPGDHARHLAARWRSLAGDILPNSWTEREWRLSPPLAFSSVRPSAARHAQLWRAAGARAGAPALDHVHWEPVHWERRVRHATGHPIGASPTSDARVDLARGLLKTALHYHLLACPDQSQADANRRLEHFVSALPARAMYYSPRTLRPAWRRRLTRWRDELFAPVARDDGCTGRPSPETATRAANPSEPLEMLMLIMPPPCNLCLALILCPARCPVNAWPQRPTLHLDMASRDFQRPAPVDDAASAHGRFG